MLRRFTALIVLMGTLAGFCSVPAFARQQPGGGQTLLAANLGEGALPVEPAFVRLLRINIAPGAVSPKHTHPGLEIGLIDSGTIEVLVKGYVEVVRSSGQAQVINDQHAYSQLVLDEGDSITYYPDTEMEIANRGDRPASILTIVILPAGNGHPDGVAYVDGIPSEDAFSGITPEILGDGIANTLPIGESRIILDRVSFSSGLTIPASVYPTMLSLESGAPEFRLVRGAAQVSRFESPGPQPGLAPSTEFTLEVGDALFLPEGIREVDLEESGETLTFLRLVIEPTGSSDPHSTDRPAGLIDIKAEKPATPTRTNPPERTYTCGDEADVLAGNLGGSRSSFECLFGQPDVPEAPDGSSPDAWIDPEFVIPNVVIMAEYGGSGEDQWVSKIQVVVSGVPDAENAALMASLVINSLAPVDTECNPENGYTSDGTLIMPCFSVGLFERFGVGEFQLQILLLKDGIVFTLV